MPSTGTSTSRSCPSAPATHIGARGIEPASQETYGNGVRKVIYRDPDGNEIGLGGAPLE